jgi:hypothetical protein
MAKYVFTGNEVILYLNGVEVDLVQNLRGTDDYGFEPASGIGDIHAFEYVPTMARHSIAISKFALRLETAVTAGIIQENGDAALANAPIEIEIFSKLTGALIKKYLGVSNSSADIAVTAHRVVVEDANFVAIDTSGTLATG